MKYDDITDDEINNIIKSEGVNGYLHPDGIRSDVIAIVSILLGNSGWDARTPAWKKLFKRTRLLLKAYLLSEIVKGDKPRTFTWIGADMAKGHDDHVDAVMHTAGTVTGRFP